MSTSASDSALTNVRRVSRGCQSSPIPASLHSRLSAMLPSCGHLSHPSCPANTRPWSWLCLACCQPLSGLCALLGGHRHCYRGGHLQRPPRLLGLQVRDGPLPVHPLAATRTLITPARAPTSCQRRPSSSPGLSPAITAVVMQARHQGVEIKVVDQDRLAHQ